MSDKTEIIYKKLFHKYYPSLLFYATRILNDEVEAEDVVQNVFVELWKQKDSMEFGEQIQSFLYRAVYTRSLNAIKHRNVRRGYSNIMQEINEKRTDFYHPDNNEIIRKIEDKELRKQIYDAIDELPDKCKKVFKLSYLHHLRNKEIADIMEISLRTVEAHMYKALKFLRDKLEHLILLLVFFLLN